MWSVLWEVWAVVDWRRTVNCSYDLAYVFFLFFYLGSCFNLICLGEPDELEIFSCLGLTWCYFNTLTCGYKHFWVCMKSQAQFTKAQHLKSWWTRWLNSSHKSKDVSKDMLTLKGKVFVKICRMPVNIRIFLNILEASVVISGENKFKLFSFDALWSKIYPRAIFHTSFGYLPDICDRLTHFWLVG